MRENAAGKLYGGIYAVNLELSGLVTGERTLGCSKAFLREEGGPLAVEGDRGSKDFRFLNW